MSLLRSTLSSIVSDNLDTGTGVERINTAALCESEKRAAASEREDSKSVARTGYHPLYRTTTPELA